MPTEAPPLRLQVHTAGRYVEDYGTSGSSHVSGWIWDPGPASPHQSKDQPKAVTLRPLHEWQTWPNLIFSGSGAQGQAEDDTVAEKQLSQ